MSRCETTQFGFIEYEEAAVVQFPGGLPAFERETRFLLIEQTETAPVVFLQSIVTPPLLFMALPARMVDPGFRLELQPEDQRALGIDGEPGRELVEGEDLISLAILTVRQGVVTANLLAPVVIAARTRLAHQVIQTQSAYRVDHPLTGALGC
jgi:flagellar assembly factor FliW